MKGGSIFNRLFGTTRKQRVLPQPTGLCPDRNTLQQVAVASYDKQAPATIGALRLVSQTPTLVFYEAPSKVIVVGVRGTADAQDVKADLSIPLNRLELSDRFKKDAVDLQAFQQKFPPNQWTYFGVGHSLGGAVLDLFLKKGLIQSGLSYNAAVQPQDYTATLPVQRVYLDGDPMYALMGKMLQQKPEVRPATRKSYGNTIWQTYNTYQNHLLSNFKGGMYVRGHKGGNKNSAPYQMTQEWQGAGQSGGSFLSGIPLIGPIAGLLGLGSGTLTKAKLMKLRKALHGKGDEIGSALSGGSMSGGSFLDSIPLIGPLAGMFGLGKGKLTAAKLKKIQAHLHGMGEQIDASMSGSSSSGGSSSGGSSSGGSMSGASSSGGSMSGGFLEGASLGKRIKSVKGGSFLDDFAKGIGSVLGPISQVAGPLMKLAPLVGLGKGGANAMVQLPVADGQGVPSLRGRASSGGAHVPSRLVVGGSEGDDDEGGSMSGGLYRSIGGSSASGYVKHLMNSRSFDISKIRHPSSDLVERSKTKRTRRAVVRYGSSASGGEGEATGGRKQSAGQKAWIQKCKAYQTAHGCSYKEAMMNASK